MDKKNVQLALALDFDFLLIGLACSWKDYRFCYLLNKTLGIDLHKVEDMELTHAKGAYRSYHPHFVAIKEQLEINILANKGLDAFLIPELKQLDYFMVIKGFMADVIERCDDCKTIYWRGTEKRCDCEYKKYLSNPLK